MKGTKPVVNCALLGPLILKVLGQTCAAIFLIGFFFFIRSLRQEIDRTELIWKTHPRNISSMRSTLFNKNGYGRIIGNTYLIKIVLTWTWNSKQQSIVATTLKWCSSFVNNKKLKSGALEMLASIVSKMPP